MYNVKYLTKKAPRLDDSGEWQNIAKGVGIQEIIDRLAEYEKAEKQGRLVMLPCMVGDALFVTNEETPLPAVRMVELVTWCNGKVFIRAVNSRTGIDYYCSAEDFGKTVFLTREEANAAMRLPESPKEEEND